jgi:opacity protein-like surface antigen
MKPTLLIIAVAMALAAVVSPVSPAYAEPYGSGWYGEIQAVYERDDNISRTYKRDKVNDNVAYISIGGGYSRKYGDRAQLILSACLAQSKYDEYKD